MDYSNKFCIYKPNRTNTGSALQMDYNAIKKCTFLEMAKQTGEQKFDWANKLVFKMNDVDLAKILLVLEGKKQTAELFHDPNKGKEAPGEIKNNTLSVSKGTFGFFIKLSQQKQDATVVSVNCSLSDEEALIASVLMRNAIEKTYGW